MPRRLYLQDPDLVKHSRFHTAYVGDGPVGADRQTFSLQFRNGIAYDVPDQHAQRFIDAGIAGTKKPSTGREEE
jgi:hypothetical protein